MSLLEKRENQRNKKSKYLQNPDIKTRHKANKYANMKAEVDKVCTDKSKRGATYDSGKDVDDALMCKMATEAICQYNKDTPPHTNAPL